MLSVAEDEGTVMVCAVLSTLSSTIFDIQVTLATKNGTGMYHFTGCLNLYNYWAPLGVVSQLFFLFV